MSEMEKNSNIASFLEGKSVLITGATGYLAKILLEKLLRVQPNIEKVFLLIRAQCTESCEWRLCKEILEKDLFRVLKKEQGESFSSFIAEKVVAVRGDISYENLGIQDPHLRDQICREVDIVINSAAITKFDERYDAAMDINTFGALHVLNFAKQCLKVKVLLHVSTAYVTKENAGVIREEPLWPSMEASCLNISAEKKIADERLTELLDAKASLRTTTSAMKDLGIKRARMHGWANTYVFTKAMGEMLLEQFKGNMEVVILRPTIVSSTCMEPFPGWIEGVRTLDSILVAYAKGNLKCFIGDPEAIIDLIPGDMVVNTILAAVIAHAHESSFDQHIYHVGSSRRNPLKYGEIKDFVQVYFTTNPWHGGGKPVKVKNGKVLSSMEAFHKHVIAPYLLFLMVLRFLNILLCGYFGATYTKLKRKINSIIRLGELYHVYVFSRVIFDDAGTENLRLMTRENDSNNFNFDIEGLEWEDYLMKAHIPGAVKYIF